MDLEKALLFTQEGGLEAELEEAARLLEGVHVPSSQLCGFMAPHLLSEAALEHALDVAAENLELSQSWEAEVRPTWAGEGGEPQEAFAATKNPDPLDLAGGSEHRKKTPSKKGKHERGIGRKILDRGREKGDETRRTQHDIWPRRRPKDWKGPWPPK